MANCAGLLNCSQIPSGYIPEYHLTIPHNAEDWQLWNCTLYGYCAELANNDIAGLGVSSSTNRAFVQADHKGLERCV